MSHTDILLRKWLMQKYLLEFTGTVTPKPKNKDDVPVPFVETFYVVATDSTSGLDILQAANSKVTDFAHTGSSIVCNGDW